MAWITIRGTSTSTLGPGRRMSVHVIFLKYVWDSSTEFEGEWQGIKINNQSREGGEEGGNDGGQELDDDPTH